MAKKLRDSFITTAELLAVQNPAELKEKTGLGEGICINIVRAARRQVGMFGFRSGLEVEQELASKPFLRTGVPTIDESLMGGIEPGSLVELYGPARGGKTQWCAQLAVRAQLPRSQGGLEGRVLWLDTEKSFSPRTIRAMAIRFGLDPDICLGNISRARVVVAGQIVEMFDTVPHMCAENNYRLVVVDSLTGLFRAEYVGLEALKARQQEMNTILNQMRRAAAGTDAIFVYTNQVLTGISAYMTVENMPVGGHITSHASDYRFYTRPGKKKDNIRTIQLQDNAGVPEFSAEVYLGWGGFYETKQERDGAEAKIMEVFRAKGWGVVRPGEGDDRAESAESDTAG